MKKYTSALALLLTMASASSLAETTLGVGYTVADFTPAEAANPSFDHGLFMVSMGYQPAKHFKTTLFAGFATDEKELSTQFDTYREPLPIGGEVLTDTYRSTSEVKNMMGAEVSFVLPTAKHIELQFDLGYATAKWTSLVYADFVDNKPAADHEQALVDGASDCEITGKEGDICGIAITSSEPSGRISAPYAGVTLTWGISKNTSIVFNGKRTLTDNKGEFSSFGVGLSLAW